MNNKTFKGLVFGSLALNIALLAGLAYTGSYNNRVEEATPPAFVLIKEIPAVALLQSGSGTTMIAATAK